MRAHFSPAVSLLWPLALLLLSCTHVEENAAEAPVYETSSPVVKDTEVTRDFVAQIRAIRHIDIRALERGYLQTIFVDEGQSVKKGQPMFQVLPTMYQAELHKAQAEAAYVDIEYRNTKRLAAGNVVSPQEVALAKAKLDKANAEVAVAQVHLGFTEIKAPFDGIMDRLKVRQGSLVDEGQELTTLSDNSVMWVYFNVNEREYLDYKARTATGDVPTVKLELANGQIFEELGRVETIEADFNNETGTIAFRATFPNPKGVLRHGETGKVLLPAPIKNAMLIPQKATFEVLDKRFAFVIDKEGVAHARAVVVDQELPQLFVISKGLAVGDRFLLEGMRKVKDGEKVQTKQIDPATVLANLEVPAE